MSLLDELENAVPEKKDVTPQNWPVSAKVFAWKLSDDALNDLLAIRPKDNSESKTEFLEFGIQMLSKCLSNENERGEFDNDRGRSFLSRLGITMRGELFDSVAAFLELAGPSDERKKE